MCKKGYVFVVVTEIPPTAICILIEWEYRSTVQQYYTSSAPGPYTFFFSGANFPEQAMTDVR
jgi:hypothetical protein